MDYVRFLTPNITGLIVLGLAVLVLFVQGDTDAFNLLAGIGGGIMTGGAMAPHPGA